MLLIVVASALKRMSLYEYEWGLTEKRLLVSVFIGAITVVFLWFLATVWRGQPRRFAFGLLIAGMLTVGGLDIVNPDAIVIKTDIARSNGLAYFDADYLGDLGSDAVPQIVRGLATVSTNERPLLARKLLAEWKDVPQDWRTYNTSVAAAQRTVVAHRAELEAIAAKPGRVEPDPSEDSDP